MTTNNTLVVRENWKAFEVLEILERNNNKIKPYKYFVFMPGL